jgi:hypothetical protein
MSRRRLDPPPPDEDWDEDDEDDDEDVPDEEDVEYFVDPDEEVVSTSVPKSAQLSHNWSSAPSTFAVVSDPRSAPHISHCGIVIR